MPFMVVVFAMTASAFTALDHSGADDNAIQGYVFNDNPQLPCDEVQVDCSIMGTILCTHNGKQAYRLIAGTSCSSELWRN